MTQKELDQIIDKCAGAAEDYWNDALLQKTFSISEYIFSVVSVEKVDKN